MSASILGIVLIVLGVLEERKTIPLPPIIGGVALAGGIALVLAGSRK